MNLLYATVARRVIAGLVVLAVAFGARTVLNHSTHSVASSDPTIAPAGHSVYGPAGFQRAISAVQGKVGPRTGVLEVSLLPGQADFVLRNGERAFGYRWNASTQSLSPLVINVIGSGTLKGQDFPLAQVRPAPIGKIVAALAGEHLSPTTMTLRRQAVDGLVGWAISAQGGGREAVAYTANADGGHVSNVVKSATSSVNLAAKAASQAQHSGGPSVKAAETQLQCVENAHGDVNALAQCAGVHP